MVVVKLPGIMSGSIMFQNIIVYYGIKRDSSSSRL